MLPDPSGDHLFLHPEADPPWPDSAHRSTDVPVARQLNATGNFVPAVPPSAYGEELPLVVRAGTLAIIRKECWHRGSQNTSSKRRYMFKQGILRVSPPSAVPPTWVHRSPAWLCRDPDPGFGSLQLGPDANGIRPAPRTASPHEPRARSLNACMGPAAV